MKIVISQPMFFPWVGLFEQIRLADIYVHYDDVQFSKGSFVNRVQITNAEGSKWLTVPLDNLQLGQEIREVKVKQKKDWCIRHINFLSQVYAKAPYSQEMLTLVQSVYSQPTTTIAEVAIDSINVVCQYFEIGKPDNFLYSSKLNIPGKASQRVLDIVKYLNGDIYITGHGARKYLNHNLFEENGVCVEYMNYQKKTYPQLYGEFTPYVSILDLIANMGKAGRKIITSETINWKEFI
jgi:hypothetical protein